MGGGVVKGKKRTEGDLKYSKLLIMAMRQFGIGGLGDDGRRN